MTNHSAFRQMDLTCRVCGWQGKGRQCRVYEVYEVSQMTDYACPQCEECIGAAYWPEFGSPKPQTTPTELSAPQRKKVSAEDVEALRHFKPLPPDHPLREKVVFHFAPSEIASRKKIRKEIYDLLIDIGELQEEQYKKTVAKARSLPGAPPSVNGSHSDME